VRLGLRPSGPAGELAGTRASSMVTPSPSVTRIPLEGALTLPRRRKPAGARTAAPGQGRRPRYLAGGGDARLGVPPSAGR